MSWRNLILAALAAAALGAAPAAAQPVNTGNVEGQLHSSRTAVAPGETFTVILRQQIREGWHTYWRNPGDSGEPTELTWADAQGFRFGALQFPAPEAVPYAGIVNYGYHGEVLMPVEVTAPANARPGQTINLSAGVYWLVCADICIPEEGTLTLSVPIAAQGADDPMWAARAREAVAALPQAFPGDARVTAGTPARLSLARPSVDIRNPHFFTYNRDMMAHSEPQRPRAGPQGFSFDIPAGVAQNLGQVPLEGVVTFEANEGGRWVKRAFEVDAAPGEAIAGANDNAATITNDYPLAEIEGAGGGAAVQAESMSGGALIIALGLALLAGLVLNIMPCVLPILSVKALGFAHGAQSGQARRQGLLYLAGVMVTFLALAGLLIALRAGGEALGWGFQLQQPWVISALALLFVAIGLNLLGVFEIGGGAQNTGSALASRGGDAGAFFTGALAVVAATPCTAPFMAGATAAVLTQSAPVTLLIFAFLALGFALPMTALHFVPALQRMIPKPGVWMERVKYVLAFPMFATAGWLVSVLGAQMGPSGAFAILLAASALAFALFVARWGRAWIVAGVLVVAVTAAFTWRPLIGVQAVTHLTPEAWSAARVTELRNEGRAVFVNFTAEWCVTCKVNEAAALSSPRVAQAFADGNVAYLKADWTNRDDTIAAALAEHGRVGVPLYLFYPAGGGDAIALPVGIVLDEATVIDTISGGGSP